MARRQQLQTEHGWFTKMSASRRRSIGVVLASQKLALLAFRLPKRALFLPMQRQINIQYRLPIFGDFGIAQAVDAGQVG